MFLSGSRSEGTSINNNAQPVSAADETKAMEQGIGDLDEPEADQLVEPGELSFDEDTRGGLGRHLGLFVGIGREIPFHVPTPDLVTDSCIPARAMFKPWETR